VSDAGGSGCNCLSHPALILADQMNGVNHVSFQTLNKRRLGLIKFVLFTKRPLTAPGEGVIIKYRINLLKFYLGLPNRVWDRFGGKIDEKHKFDYENS
jgi:hypothetical protein